MKSQSRSRRSAHSDRVDRREALRILGIGLGGGLAVGAGAFVLMANVGRSGQSSNSTDVAARFANVPVAEAPNGDLAKVVWPPELARISPEVRRLYEFNITNGELMRYMPCFCGCHLEDGHRNNRDCYVETVRSDGAVILDLMAPT